MYVDLVGKFVQSDITVTISETDDLESGDVTDTSNVIGSNIVRQT